ncbi:ABC transporter ATP-binding protein [Chloroflexota bacterium]
MLLRIKDLVVHYGKLEAVSGVSMEVADGQVVTLLGANGSGKSTILKTISGLLKPTRGEIWYQDRRIDGLPSTHIVSSGIGHVPEGRRLFPRMTVKENLELGAYTRGGDKKGIQKNLEEVYEHFPVLKEKSGSRADQLSGGQQEMVAIGRALMLKPKLLLMDEPAQGLAPLMIEEIENIVRQFHQSNIAVILVEHNVHMALGLAHHVLILDTGKIALSGSPQDMSQTEYVKKVYLAG